MVVNISIKYVIKAYYFQIWKRLVNFIPIPSLHKKPKKLSDLPNQGDTTN